MRLLFERWHYGLVLCDVVTQHDDVNRRAQRYGSVVRADAEQVSDLRAELVPPQTDELVDDPEVSESRRSPYYRRLRPTTLRTVHLGPANHYADGPAENVPIARLDPTPEQLAALQQEKSIVLVEGRAGSGKTSVVCEAMTSSCASTPGGTFVYVTWSDDLVKYAVELCPSARADAFITYKELALQVLGEPPSTEITPFAYFEGWYNRYQSKRKTWLGEARNAWWLVRSEIKGRPSSVASAVPRSRRKIELPKDRRDEAERLTDSWNEHLCAENRQDEMDLAKRALDRLRSDGGAVRTFDGMYCDEVQDLTLLQIELLLGLRKPSGRIMLAGDDYQVIHPTGFAFDELKLLVTETLGSDADQVVAVMLPRGLRSADPAHQLAEGFRKGPRSHLIRPYLIKQERNAPTASSNYEGFKPVCITGTDEQMVIDVLAELGPTAKLAVLTMSDDDAVRVRESLAAAANRGREDLKPGGEFLVETVDGAKGREYEGVLLWQPFRAIEEVAQKVDGDPLKERGYDILEQCNRVYVALTRARENVFVYEADDTPLAALEGRWPNWDTSLLRSGCPRELGQMSLEPTTTDEWVTWAKRYEDEEQWRRAAGYYRNASCAQAAARCEARALAVEGRHDEAALAFRRLADLRSARKHYESAGDRRGEAAAAAELAEQESEWEAADKHWRRARHAAQYRKYTGAEEAWRETGVMVAQEAFRLRWMKDMLRNLDLALGESSDHRQAPVPAHAEDSGQ